MSRLTPRITRVPALSMEEAKALLDRFQQQHQAELAAMSEHVHGLAGGGTRGRATPGITVRVLPDTPKDLIALLPEEFEGRPLRVDRRPRAQG